MTDLQLLLLILGIVGSSMVLFSLALGLYIKIHYLPKLDRLVLGFEFAPHGDNYFYAMMRITNYGGGFCCDWCARRSKIADKIAGVDKKTRRPFQIYFCTMMLGGAIMAVGTVLFRIYVPEG